MPEIILNNVTKRFGDVTAVDNVSMVIDDRAFVTLLGPSGCGKTTILRMIAGLETPTEGEIIIDGVTVFDAEKRINVSPAKRDVGFLFQNYALWPHMTVYDNVAFGLESLKWEKADIEVRVMELLEMLQIENLVDRYPNELSGGQQQRVAIARTLAPRPKVLFMDEPLSNLDAKLRLEMRTELKRLHRETSSTFVYVTHDQLEAMTLATEICLLKEGLLQQYEPPLTVYSRPQNIFVADFVGNPTMNFIEVEYVGENQGHLELKNENFTINYLPKEEYSLNLKPGEKLRLGVRPEYVMISEEGSLAHVESSLPGGMETTVVVNLGGLNLLAVVFGIIDFEYKKPVNISFKEGDILLFSEDTTERIASGSMKITDL